MASAAPLSATSHGSNNSGRKDVALESIRARIARLKAARASLPSLDTSMSGGPSSDAAALAQPLSASSSRSTREGSRSARGEGKPPLTSARSNRSSWSSKVSGRRREGGGFGGSRPEEKVRASSQVRAGKGSNDTSRLEVNTSSVEPERSSGRRMDTIEDSPEVHPLLASSLLLESTHPKKLVLAPKPKPLSARSSTSIRSESRESTRPVDKRGASVSFLSDSSAETASSGQERKGSSCANCMKRTVVIWCNTCGVGLCGACDTTLHPRSSRVLSSHVRTREMNDGEKRAPAKTVNVSVGGLLSLDLCREHGAASRWWCEECLADICAECALSGGAHEGHPVSRLSVAASKMISSLPGLKGASSASFDSLASLVIRLETAQHQMDAANAAASGAIKSSFAAVRQQLDLAEARALEAVGHAGERAGVDVDGVLGRVSAAKKAAEERSAQLNDTHGLVQALDSEDDAGALRVLRSLESVSLGVSTDRVDTLGSSVKLIEALAEDHVSWLRRCASNLTLKEAVSSTIEQEFLNSELYREAAVESGGADESVTFDDSLNESAVYEPE